MVTTALHRAVPSGASAGAPLSRIEGPRDALALVAEQLAESEQALKGLVQSNVADISSISEYLLNAGGKRLRPAMTALGALAVGYEKPVARLMCVGELIHLGSLLHDDVVDGALKRRGLPAAHIQFGNAATILSGDFCLARAMLLASEEGGGLAGQELARAVTEMAEGEVMQLRWAGDLSCNERTYMEWVERKSAALISWCVSAPAWSMKDHRTAATLSTFGRRVGIAFQITDDVLDYRSGTGKRVGADLRQRKVTLPLIHAMNKDESIRDILEEGTPSESTVRELVRRVESTGATETSLEHARALVLEGIDCLGELPASEGRDALEVLGAYLVERVS